MRKETFIFLCEKLQLVIYRRNTCFREAIGVEVRVAITLWCLATPCEYHTIGHLFGVARSTVCEIVQETCRAIVSSLMQVYIKLRSGDALKPIVEGFERKLGFPQCAGAIDGSRIPSLLPN